MFLFVPYFKIFSIFFTFITQNITECIQFFVKTEKMTWGRYGVISSPAPVPVHISTARPVSSVTILLLLAYFGNEETCTGLRRTVTTYFIIARVSTYFLT